MNRLLPAVCNLILYLPFRLHAKRKAAGPNADHTAAAGMSIRLTFVRCSFACSSHKHVIRESRIKGRKFNSSVLDSSLSVKADRVPDNSKEQGITD